MFFDTLTTMLQKENLSEYLMAKINTLKINPSQRLQCYIVQVVSSELITDGVTNFPARFKKQLKKGSIIRLIQWKLDFASFEIVIEECQYLGGAGYGSKGGKLWDVEKLKLITNSSIISRDFIVLHNPQPQINTTLKNPWQSQNVDKTKQLQTFKLTAAKTKRFQVKVHNQKNMNTKILGLINSNNKSGSEEKMDMEATEKCQPKGQEPWKYGTQNPEKIFKYSLVEIENVRKLRVGEQVDQKTLSILSIRELMAKRRQGEDKNEEKPRSESLRRQIYDEKLIQIDKGTLNEDSKGRHLIFNKDEVKKLLGKE